MFELICYLYIKNRGNRKLLRMLYKYQYHLTEYEKRTNPERGDFINEMDILYQNYID